MPSITTRRATAEDIDEFKDVVVDSVLELCNGHYTPEQLQSLLAQYPHREVYGSWIHERVLLVAESEGEIIGFAQYYPPNNSIEAVHVASRIGRHGVGKMLVVSIEEVARNQGAQRIWLDASLNATEFYEKCGYSRIGAGTFKCNDGAELEVVRYEKVLCS